MIDVAREWRIDALDARGGLAFASQRDHRFSEIEHGGASPLCVFIGAPGFQPEIVANRSVALASIRGAFQFRLYVDTEEVVFPTLEAVAQFVRRAFLRGGGGDGAGGEGGDGPTPVPDGGLPDLPRALELIERGGERTLADMIAGATSLFGKESGNCKPGEAVPFDGWPGSKGPDSSGPTSTSGSSILANAALSLLHEMLRRMPDGRDARALMRWRRDARGVGRLLGTMRLWPILWGPPYRHAIGTLLKQLGLQRSGLDAVKFIQAHIKEDDEVGVCLTLLLFCTILPLDESRSGSAVLDSRYWPYGISPLETGAGSLDPVTDLGRIPCPSDLAAKVRGTTKDAVSLYHVLISFVGAPVAAGGTDPRLLELILFAATWIATSADRAAGLYPGLFVEAGWPGSINQAVIEDKLDRGWNWLRMHLPHLCFEPRVETAIDDAAKLVYPMGAVEAGAAG